MRSFTKHRLCSALCILLGIGLLAGRTRAANETYGYTYHITQTVNIWDVSGTYSHDVLGTTVSHTITQDAAGKLTGTGTLSVEYMGATVTGPFTIQGSVRQSGGRTLAKMTLRFAGTASYQGETFHLRGVDKVSAVVDPATTSMTGTIYTRVSAAGESVTYRGSYFESLPAGMDGSSDLTIHLTRTGNKLTGTGQLQLSNGDTYEFSDKGTVSVAKNLDKVTLSSPQKQKLKLTIERATGEIAQLTGKVLGQSLKAKHVPGTVLR